VLKLFLQVFGWILARTPEPLLRAATAATGESLYWLWPRRRRLTLSNLHHVFPSSPPAWRRAVARESSRRMVETALLSLAMPYLGETRLRRIVTAAPALEAAFAQHRADPQPTLFCAPHLAYWEAQTAMPLVLPAPFPEFGIIFRPLENAAANQFVTRSRERFGMKLLSRKEGFAAALKILRRRGFIGVLFDQNAGLQGALTTLFGRVCSTSELPGLMAEKFSARVYGIFSRRHAFWRIEISVEPVNSDGTTAGVTIALNRWLENLLRRNDDLCASWLWAHDRWRNQDIPQKRFRLEAKRDLLAADLQARGLATLPHQTRLWVRLPNWLGDVVMALPLLRALRASRPDAEITLVAKKQFLPLLESWGVADHCHALPPHGPAYFVHFWQLRREFPDVWLLFTNSVRGDLEARLTGCRQRFGLVRPGKHRPLLSHAYRVPADFDERTHHQLELWEIFLRHFGLNAAADRTPISNLESEISNPHPIALICGSENNPEKRWPVAHWRALIAAFPAERFVLLGTANDAPITSAIAAGSDASRLEDLAGKTTLPEFAARLRSSRLLVTNDTGGMHLANALGVPLLALFGPTNPLRTAPVFSSPVRILQPPHCPPAGGAPLAALPPDTAAAALRELLTTPASRPPPPPLDIRH
jgi:ADP-heptose:LPS heptosyltransferase/lauroyl/myristoyl acyltransferase